MSSLGTSKGILEIGKFAVYVTVPIGLMYFFANNSKNLQKIMGKGLLELADSDAIARATIATSRRQYVVYPPEAPRPPSPEEMREIARELARNRDRQ